jgi:hypothetical protein
MRGHGEAKRKPPLPGVQAVGVIPIFRDDAKRTDTGKQMKNPDCLSRIEGTAGVTLQGIII